MRRMILAGLLLVAGCGTPRPGPTPVPHRDPVVAGALSFLIPGLGQLYNQQGSKGFLFLAGAGASMFIHAGEMDKCEDPFACSGADLAAGLYLVNWGTAVVDAAVTAGRINRAQVSLLPTRQGLTLQAWLPLPR